MSRTACIASFRVWTGLQRAGIARTLMTILETNGAQSAAGYSTAVTVGTAVRAMLLLSATDADPRGIDRERLRFPSGTAAAVLLHSLYTEGREALAKGRALFAAAVVRVAVPVLEPLHVRHGRDASVPVESAPLNHRA